MILHYLHFSLSSYLRHAVIWPQCVLGRDAAVVSPQCALRAVQLAALPAVQLATFARHNLPTCERNAEMKEAIFTKFRLEYFVGRDLVFDMAITRRIMLK